MKTFDWQRLVREHDEAPECDDAEWAAALELMDEDPAERERALDADPLLLFRRLGAPAAGPAVSGGDVDAMKAAVAGLREASEKLAEGSEPFADEPFDRRRPELSRAAARIVWPLAALLAVALSSVLFFGPRAERPASAASVAAASILEAERRVAYFSPAPGSRDATRPATVAARFAASGLPLVEDADPASDLVMQIEDEDLSLVVVLTGQDV